MKTFSIDITIAGDGESMIPDTYEQVSIDVELTDIPAGQWADEIRQEIEEAAKTAVLKRFPGAYLCTCR